MTQFSTVVALSKEGFAFVGRKCYAYVVQPVLLYIIILPLAGVFRQRVRFVVLRVIPDIRGMGRVVTVTLSVIILLVIVVGVLHRTITGVLRRIRSTGWVSQLIAFPDLFKHKDRIYVVLILQMRDQVFVVFLETGEKTLFLHLG